MKIINMITFIIVVISAMNWAFIEFLSFNVISYFFGFNHQILRSVYAVIGISALWCLRSLTKKSFRESIVKLVKYGKTWISFFSTLK